jgi:hypothetical protein
MHYGYCILQIQYYYLFSRHFFEVAVYYSFYKAYNGQLFPEVYVNLFSPIFLIIDSMTHATQVLSLT